MQGARSAERGKHVQARLRLHSLARVQHSRNECIVQIVGISRTFNCRLGARIRPNPSVPRGGWVELALRFGLVDPRSRKWLRWHLRNHSLALNDSFAYAG